VPSVGIHSWTFHQLLLLLLLYLHAQYRDFCFPRSHERDEVKMSLVIIHCVAG
jgi:hypothetical protein